MPARPMLPIESRRLLQSLRASGPRSDAIQRARTPPQSSDLDPLPSLRRLLGAVFGLSCLAGVGTGSVRAVQCCSWQRAGEGGPQDSQPMQTLQSDGRRASSCRT
jgi:hypothetical protein